ncbi:MAG TPA: hypothetical protein VGB19_09960 [Actinomycetota bacterium]
MKSMMERGAPQMAERGLLRGRHRAPNEGRRAGDGRRPISDEDRARKYLTEGRMTLHLVEPGRIRATCTGFSGDHRLGLEPGQGWWCTCPEVGLCAHLLAVQLVTEVKPGGFTAGT